MPDIHIDNVRLIEFPTMTDPRGSLSICQKEEMPFPVKRVFWIYDTPGNLIRGGHAHKKTSQIHISFGGKTTFNLDDGIHKQTVVLDNPRFGLLIGPMVWHPFTIDKGASFQTLSSQEYDAEDYIHSYEDFLSLTVPQKQI